MILATHYFWTAGTSLQKSQVGLFRTLLFQIFSQSPELIPLVAPDRWVNSLISLETWSRSELLAAFTRFATVTSKEKLKIYVFVDGLDEYCGDHHELANVFCALSKSPHLKLCLSSHPWQVFIDAFGQSLWSLRVQDLTQDDIRVYIRDNLQEDNRFLELEKQDRGGANQLAAQIQKKADGVFLWVYLVVRSLLRGLANSDTMTDLQFRLDELPAELEKYFELMLSTIEPIYRPRTALVFRVMLAESRGVPIVTFHFVNQEAAPPCTEIEPWSDEEIKTVVDQQRRQLNAICKDLLCISTRLEESAMLRTRVTFLHRTVIDFLKTSEMEEMLSHQSVTAFNANLSLCRAYWATYKAYPGETPFRKRMDWKHQHLLLGRIFYHAKEVEMQSGYPVVDVLDEMNSNISPDNWTYLDTAQGQGFTCILDIAVRVGLQLYVVEQIQQLRRQNQDPDIANEKIANLLRVALRGGLSAEGDDDRLTASYQTDLSMVRCLLENGADPNTILLLFYESSVWSDYLFTCLDSARKRPREKPSKSEPLAESSVNDYKACELLISYGASRHCKRKSNFTVRSEQIKADVALREIFHTHAEPLIRLLDQKQGKATTHEEKQTRSCLVM